MKQFIFAGLALGLVVASGAPRAAGEPDMIATMGQMQLFLHKISLSVEAGNRELADFYAHELEETIEAAESIEEYHDIPVGELTAAMLTPGFEAFEAALDGDDAGQVESRMGDLIEACNACHQATGYEFIRIEPNDTNPYMQSFEPKD